MSIIVNFEEGEIIELRKIHPCGSDKWKVLKKGVDYRLQCIGCNHIILIPRIKLAKMLKKNTKNRIEDK